MLQKVHHVVHFMYHHLIFVAYHTKCIILYRHIVYQAHATPHTTHIVVSALLKMLTNWVNKNLLHKNLFLFKSLEASL